MKKIILSIIISSLSLGAIAQGVFNTQIPQPDFVSNDWDGDGIINSIDDDDDNDGDKDFEDSTPFGQVGSSETISEENTTCAEGGLTVTSVGELNNFQSIYNLDSDGWCALTTLGLDGANTNEIPESIGNLTNLNTLQIGGNNLTSIPDSIGNLTNLNHLSLEDNQLIVIPDSIGNLINLNFLYLYSNQLTSVPDSIGNLTNLIFFYLQNNQLTSVPDSINDFNNLARLYLQDNLEIDDFANISCVGISICNK